MRESTMMFKTAHAQKDSCRGRKFTDVEFESFAEKCHIRAMCLPDLCAKTTSEKGSYLIKSDRKDAPQNDAIFSSGSKPCKEAKFSQN